MTARRQQWEDFLSKSPESEACKSSARQLFDIVEKFPSVTWGKDADGGIGIASDHGNKFLTLTSDEDGEAWVCFHTEPFEVIELNDTNLATKIQEFLK